jgi:hypothetical protein
MQQVILLNAAHASYTPPPDPSRPGVQRIFWAAVDVPVMQDRTTILAPDFLLALDEARPSDPDVKSYDLSHRSAPGLMVEHVSNREGRELGKKMRTYAEWGCLHYVVYDPERRISRKVLQVFELVNGQYVEMSAPHYFPSLGVGVKLWKDGGTGETFLRLCDKWGDVLLTGDEKSERERARAERAEERVSAVEQAANTAKAEVEALRKVLRDLGLKGYDSR